MKKETTLEGVLFYFFVRSRGEIEEDLYVVKKVIKIGEYRRKVGVKLICILSSRREKKNKERKENVVSFLHFGITVRCGIASAQNNFLIAR